jgi:polysaccharide biosynthesis transport protein
VLIPAGVYVLSKELPKTYEASTTLQVQQTSVPSTLFSGGSTTTSTLEGAARLIKTTAVARKAAHLLGEPPSQAGGLLGDVSVDTASSTGETNDQFLTITARGGTARRAARTANAFARGLSNLSAAQSISDINKTIKVLALQGQSSQPDVATRKELANQLQQLRALRAVQASSTHVIQPAFPPGSATSPKPLRNAAVGFVLALLIAAGLVPLLDRLDRKVRDPDELEELVGAHTLALVPEAAFSGGPDIPSVREAFQTLRATLTYFNVDRPLETVMVTSAANAEGKTTVATNLARALAQDGRDVILVDGDMRRPQAMTRLGAGVRFGLDSVLLEEKSVDDALLDVEVEGKGRLQLLPGGEGAPNAAVLLGSERMGFLLADLSKRAEIVVVDTPPLLVVSDAIPLLEDVSGVVLVARVGYSDHDAVRRVADVISAAQGTLLGVAVTGTQASGLYDGYYLAPQGTSGWHPIKRIKALFSRGDKAGSNVTAAATDEAGGTVAGGAAAPGNGARESSSDGAGDTESTATSSQ